MPEYYEEQVQDESPLDQYEQEIERLSTENAAMKALLADLGRTLLAVHFILGKEHDSADQKMEMSRNAEYMKRIDAFLVEIQTSREGR